MEPKRFVRINPGGARGQRASGRPDELIISVFAGSELAIVAHLHNRGSRLIPIAWGGAELGLSA